MFCCVKEFLLSKFFLFRGVFFRHFALNTCFSGDFFFKKGGSKKTCFLQNLFIFEKKNMITRSHRCVFFEKKGVWLVKILCIFHFLKCFLENFASKWVLQIFFFYSAFLPQKNVFLHFSKFFLKCFFETVNSRGFFHFSKGFFRKSFFFKGCFFKGFRFF